jgi:cell division protein FtsB
MRADLRSAQERMAGLEREIAESEAEAGSLGEDPFAIEQAIREDLGLARPGETVVRLADPADENLRLP